VTDEGKEGIWERMQTAPNRRRTRSIYTYAWNGKPIVPTSSLIFSTLHTYVDADVLFPCPMGRSGREKGKAFGLEE